MRYIDSNVFIYAYLDTGEKRERSEQILKEIVQGTSAITSALTINEIAWVIWKETSDREIAIEQALQTLELPNLLVLDVTARDMYSALNYMKKYQRLKPRDAIHLSVSMRAGVFRIVSDDSDFDDVGEIEREPLG